MADRAEASDTPSPQRPGGYSIRRGLLILGVMTALVVASARRDDVSGATLAAYAAGMFAVGAAVIAFVGWILRPKR